MPSPLPGAPTSGHQDRALELTLSQRVATKDPHTDSQGRPAGCRLLIVDDNVEVLTLVSRMAACLGYGTCTAANGAEALQQLQKGQVDLVITDYQMPLMDGFQLATKIRRLFPGLPVILMTGYYSDDLEERMPSRHLFDGLLKKPFNLKTLREQLSKAVASTRESLTA